MPPHELTLSSNGNDFAHLRGVIESIPAAAVVIDQTDRLIFANRKALGLLGQSIESVVGKPVSGAFYAFLGRVRARGGVTDQIQSEFSYGNAWYVLQSFSLLAADGHSPTAYSVVTATDISARKRREFDVLEIAAGLEEATRIAQMGTFKIIWAPGRFEWSPHMYTLHGVSPESFQPVTSSYTELVHPDDRDYVRRRSEELSRGEAMANVEYRIIRPDGAVRWVRLDGRVLFDSTGATYASFGTCQDITESKLREDELRELLKRNAILYEALESSPNGVAVLTAEGEGFDVLYVNAAFERLTQHNSFSLNASGLNILIPHTEIESWGRIARAMDQSLGGEFEVVCLRRDGSDFPAKIELAPVRDHPGQAASAFVVNLRDITIERARAAALLQSQKMEALGQLSGGVAHEINNLLQPVIALSDLGMDVLEKDPAKARQYFDVIGNSGRKAREVVRQVLTFARRDTPQMSSLNVVPLVADAVDLAIKGLPPQVQLEADLQVDSAMAVISATQVSQVVLNLLRNASDAMNGNGRIQLTLERCLIDESTATGELIAGPWIKLAVQDHGCGIDSVTLSRVFEPFFTTKPVGRGTGLGLSVVYSIVGGWGGVIKLESEVDKGTIAVIYIPEQT
jgi:PAS domain S-box-containing protein